MRIPLLVDSMLLSWRLQPSTILLLFVFAAADIPTLDATNSSSSSSITPLSSPPYDFIFGYSTGHVGTTSMNDGGVFGNPINMQFMHELASGPIEFPNRNKMTTAVWSKSDFKAEYKWVKDVYVPFLWKSKGTKDVLVDLGHNNLYFARALVEYLMSETAHRFIFVRLRRDRLESAISLSFDRPNRQYTDICSSLWYRLCPFDREHDVILHPPSRDAWKALSIFQQALWIVDETEAQWNKLVASHRALNHTEVLWGSKWPGSFDNATLHIGKLLGLNMTTHHQGSEHRSKAKRIHAGLDNQNAYAHLIAQQDIAYRRIMRGGLSQRAVAVVGAGAVAGAGAGAVAAGGTAGTGGEDSASSLIAYALLI